MRVNATLFAGVCDGAPRLTRLVGEVTGDAMVYAEIREDYVDLRTARLERYAKRTRMTSRQVAEFEDLEDRMNSGNKGQDWLRSYHVSNDDYPRLLEKVLKAAVAVGEPHAREKLQVFIEEMGIMGPALFMTPWDVTLAFLDKEYGEFDDVARFYS